MFEARLAQGNLYRRVMEAIVSLVSDVNLECTSTGMNIQAMDSSHVCLVSVELAAESFDPYRCDKNITLGLNVTNFLKIIRCGCNDDCITLQAQDNSDSLSVLIESPNGDKTANFEMKLMDIDAEHLGIPETQYSAVVKLPSHQFQHIVRDMSQFGDTIIISGTKEGVEFATASSASSDGSAKVTLRQSSCIEKEDDQVAIELTEPVSLTFACRYLTFFIKATPLAGAVSLSLKHDQPLVVEYKIGGDVGYVRFYLAPKIEEDDTE